jgi:plasmid stability protein
MEMRPMASMVIRNIPDDVMERFQRRAKLDGKSAEQLAREAISERAGPTVEEAWAEIDAIRARSKPVDMETWQRLWDEARDERDNRSWHPKADDDH